MSEFSIKLRIGLWANDLKLGVKQSLQAAAAMRPEVLGLDAFQSEIAPRNLGASGRRDLARHVRGIGALAALKADVGGRRLAEPGELDINLSRIRDCLQLAADLGAPRLLVPAGFVPVDSKENARVRDTLTEAVKALNLAASNSRVRVCWLAGSEAPQALAGLLHAGAPTRMLEVG